MQASDSYLVCPLPASTNGPEVVTSATLTQAQQIDASCTSRQNSTVWCLGIYTTILFFILLGIYVSFGSGETQRPSKTGCELGRGGCRVNHH